MPSPASSLSAPDLEALVETGLVLATELRAGKVIETVLERAARLTDSPDGALLLFDERRGALYFASVVGGNRGLVDAFGRESAEQVPLEESIAGEVFRSGQSRVVNTVATQGHFGKVDARTGSPTSSLITAPLTVFEPGQSEPTRLGVLQVRNKPEAYTPRDLALIERFAAQAAIAIRNARLMEDLAAQMGLYAPSGDAWKRLREPAHPERVSILFADMRGFTRLLQVVNDPTRIQAMLGQHLGMLSEQVFAHDGVVNKLLGDGVLAFFEGPDCAQRAVRTAFAMLEAFDGLKRRWDRRSREVLRFLDLGVGITTGEVIVGAVGSGRVRDFTLIGSMVNLAAAFEKAARGGYRVLVDFDTWLDAATIIEESSGPEAFLLRKPDQDHGVEYKRYSIHKIQGAASAEPPSPGTTGGIVVFLCHASVDKPAVRPIYEYLKAQGFRPWLDEVDLLPGHDWHREITHAVKTSQAVVVFLSARSVGREGYLQRELRLVLDVADEKPEGTIFVLPARLDDCDVPDRLKRIQHVDLNSPDGRERLLKSLRLRAQSLAAHRA